MNSFKRIAVVLLCGSALLLAQHKKKPAVSAIFQNARYVYVQALDGDITNPRLFPEDRQAISDVEDAIRDWHRYTLAINPSQADLIIVVRKGRLAALQGHGGISDGPRPMPPMAPGGQNRREAHRTHLDRRAVGGARRTRRSPSAAAPIRRRSRVPRSAATATEEALAPVVKGVPLPRSLGRNSLLSSGWRQSVSPNSSAR
jgi:hypothetical protein